MQAIFLISQLTSRVASALRQRHHERLSTALSRELALANPRLPADIQLLIAHANSNATPTDAPCASKASTAMAHAARKPRGFRTTPLPGLPTHIRYSSS